MGCDEMFNQNISEIVASKCAILYIPGCPFQHLNEVIKQPSLIIKVSLIPQTPKYLETRKLVYVHKVVMSEYCHLRQLTYKLQLIPNMKCVATCTMFRKYYTIQYQFC